MAGRGAMSLAENNIRPSTLTHTSGFGEARDVKVEENIIFIKSSVRDLRARFESENTWV